MGPGEGLRGRGARLSRAVRRRDGVYLKALLRGLCEGPAADPTLRRELEEEADRLGDAALHARLAELDPTTARRLHPNDRRRVVRALEVIAASGRPLSLLQTEHDRPAPEGVKVVALERSRGELRGRIDHRVVRMFAEGFEDEVRAPFKPAPDRSAPWPRRGWATARSSTGSPAG